MCQIWPIAEYQSLKSTENITTATPESLNKNTAKMQRLEVSEV